MAFCMYFCCCNSVSTDFKDFIDAEHVMPLPTSDVHLPVCMEMRRFRDPEYLEDLQSPLVPPAILSRPCSEHKKVPHKSERIDHGSVDSSETFASCNTHPSFSEGDLVEGISEHVLDSNLYVNPLDGGGRVKKSASGDTALRSLGVSPMDETFQGFGAVGRGSRGSLNDSHVPKHRKARFQGVKPSIEESSGRQSSDESLEGKKRRYLPTGKSLASATRLINQHLLGLQSLGSSKAGKQSDSRSSLSESGDSRNSPNLETQRRSKSILKKKDSSHYQYADPETEKLISDSTSGASVSINSGKDSSPNKLPLYASRGATSSASATLVRQTTNTMGLRAIGPKSSSKSGMKPLPIKFVGLPANGGDEKKPRLKSPLLPVEDWWGGEKHARDEAVSENRNKESLESPRDYEDESGCNSSQQMAPLYICPPPPPMEECSPTEETKLIAGSRSVPRS